MLKFECEWKDIIQPYDLFMENIEYPLYAGVYQRTYTQMISATVFVSQLCIGLNVHVYQDTETTYKISYVHLW